MDVQAGALIANPTPIKNTYTKITYGFSRRIQPSTAKAKAVAAIKTLIVQTNFWRSTLSARAPAGKIKKKQASDASVDIRDSNRGEPPEVFTIHVAALS